MQEIDASCASFGSLEETWTDVNVLFFDAAAIVFAK